MSLMSDGGDFNLKFDAWMQNNQRRLNEKYLGKKVIRLTGDFKGQDATITWVGMEYHMGKWQIVFVALPDGMIRNIPVHFMDFKDAFARIPVAINKLAFYDDFEIQKEDLNAD